MGTGERRVVETLLSFVVGDQDRSSDPLPTASRLAPPSPEQHRVGSEGTLRYFTFFLIHSVVTDLGRSIGEPRARFTTSCDSMPIARETENSTV